jgi:putative hydrolase of the HAD superfamily
MFDLGNTLVSYYRRDGFAGILDKAIRNVIDELKERRISSVPYEIAYPMALSENRESGDFQVNPMTDRLKRIFGLSAKDIESLGEVLSRRFLEPIFEVARVYEDTRPALERLKAKGYRTAIVSNLPWGSPTKPWREELRRLELASLVDTVVLCGDVGWRKPAPQIFLHAVQSLDVKCDECVFVGDDLEWDIEGSKAVGMRPVLIDRENRYVEHIGERVRDLREMW